MLAGLAEECTELAKEALKLRRAIDQSNPTPVTEDEARQKFTEEIADVLLYLDVIGYNKDSVKYIKDIKKSRWEDRLVGGE